MTTKREKPAKVIAAPMVARDVAHEVVAGLGVVRKPLFSAPITHDGWQKVMLTHIAAAKQLGFTMFEIDTVEGTVQRQEQRKKQPEENPFTSYFFRVQVEGEEWKGQPEVESATGEMETVRTTIVTVYALAVE